MTFPHFPLKSVPVGAALFLCLLAPQVKAKTAIEDVIIEACERLREANQNNLSSGQLLLKSRCIALFKLRDDRGEDAYQTVLNDISPEEISSQGRASQGGARLQSRNVAKRVGSMRASRQTPNKILSHYYENGPVTGASAGSLEVPRVGAFVNTNLGNADKDATDSEPAFGSEAKGVTLGADYRINDMLVAGMAIGKTDTTTAFLSDSGELSTESTSLIAYGSFTLDAWSLDLVAGKGSSDNHTERKIDYVEVITDLTTSVKTRPSGDASSNERFYFLATNYTLQRGAWTFGPFASLESISTDIDPFVEAQGEGWGIGYASQSDALTSYEAGANATYVWNQRWGVLIPGVRAVWHHFKESEREPLTARLVFDELETRTFELKPDAIDQDYQALSLEMTAVFAHGISGFASVEEFIGIENISATLLTLGVRAEL